MTTGGCFKPSTIGRTPSNPRHLPSARTAPCTGSAGKQGILCFSSSALAACFFLRSGEWARRHRGVLRRGEGRAVRSCCCFSPWCLEDAQGHGRDRRDVVLPGWHTAATSIDHRAGPGSLAARGDREAWDFGGRAEVGWGV